MFKNNFNVDKDWGNEQLHFLNKSLVNLPEVVKFLAYIYISFKILIKDFMIMHYI